MTFTIRYTYTERATSVPFGRATHDRATAGARPVSDVAAMSFCVDCVTTYSQFAVLRDGYVLLQS